MKHAITLERQLAELTTIHRRQVRKLVTIRSLWFAVLAALVLVYADLFFQLNDPTRLVADVVFVAGLIALAIRTRRWLMRATSEERRVARLIEQGNPELQNDLVNAIDFEETLNEGGRQPVSTELMQRQIDIAAERAQRVKQLDSLKPPSLRTEARLFFGSAAAACLLLIVFTDHFSDGIPRFLDPFGDHPPYSPTRLSVDPAGATIEYGQTLKVSVAAAGPKPAGVSLVLQDKKGRELSALPMFEAGDAQYFQNIESVQDDVVYFVRIPGGRSKRHQLSVTKWPKIQSATVAYEYPAYTRLAPETRYLNERIVKGYAGTKATITLLSNRPLKGGTLNVCGKDHELIPADAASVAAMFVIATNGTFSASVTDKEGNVTRERLEGTVEVLADLKPEIAIVSPGVDSFATPDAQIPINIEARDDLGVARVELVRSRNGSGDERKTVDADENSQKLVNVIETLGLAALGVKPGDTIEYYATATDTAPGAPHTAATPAYRLAVISHDQYRELLQTQMRAEDLTLKYNDLMEQLGRLADIQAELEKKVSQLQTNLEQNGALTPPEQQQVQQALAAQDELARQTEQFAKELTNEAKRPPVFDVEKDYKRALEKFAERMGQAKEAMTRSSENLKQAGDKPAGKEGLAALNSALQDQREALAQLGKNRDDYEKGVQQANRDIEKVYRLLEDSEMFKALLERQKNVERQVRSYKDVADPGLDERIRLKEFAEEQASVEQALAQLKEDFRTHARDVEADYPKVAQDARKIADEIGKRQIEDLMESASTRLDWADARGGHEKTQDAYVEMQAMVGVCNSAEGDAQAECELRLKLTMNMGLGNTLQQFAQGLKPGSGAGLGAASSGKSGTGGGRTQFAVFGPESPRKNPLSKGGGRSDRKTQAAPEQPEAVAASVEELATTKNMELELPGGGGERIMQEYRKLIEEYFKRVAEEK
jgi:hypothetical protein